MKKGTKKSPAIIIAIMVAGMLLVWGSLWLAEQSKEQTAHSSIYLEVKRQGLIQLEQYRSRLLREAKELDSVRGGNYAEERDRIAREMKRVNAEIAMEKASIGQ